MSLRNPLLPEIEGISAKVIKAALERGASAADFISVARDEHMLSFSDGSPEKNVTGYSRGAGLRTISSDGRQGVAYVSSFGREDLEDLVDWSWKNSCSSEPDPFVTLYEGPTPRFQDMGLYDSRIPELTPGMRMEKCIEMTEAVRETDSRVLSVRSASWADGELEVYYGSSRGFSGSYSATYASCGAAVVLREGEQREMGGFGDEARNLSSLNHLDIAKEAVSRTAIVLGGKPQRTGRYDLVLDPEATVSILEILGELFLSSNVYKGKSLLLDRIGSEIASPLLTIIDDGTRWGGMGTSPFDGEGYPTAKTTLMERGKVTSFLYNLRYACMRNVSSTGNACRGISSLPDVDVSNIYIEPGEITPEKLVSGTRKGIYVMEFQGLHTVDPASGDFSLGIRGCFINDGEMAGAISGMTIAGNIIDMLFRIEYLGNDLRFFGNTGGPTLVVKDVSAAGI